MSSQNIHISVRYKHKYLVLMDIFSNFYSSEGIQNEDHDPWKRKLP